MSKTLPVLMKDEDEFGPANPDGWKLEDLCVQLIIELNDKNHKAREEKDLVLCDTIIFTNNSIIKHLVEIVTLQHDIMRHLSKHVGPNRGLHNQRTSRNVIYPDSVEEEINF